MRRQRPTSTAQETLDKGPTNAQCPQGANPRGTGPGTHQQRRPSGALPQTQASTAGRRLRPARKRLTPPVGGTAHRPPTSERPRRPTDQARKFNDGGLCRRPTLPRYRPMVNRLGKSPMTPACRNPQPWTKVPTSTLPQTQRTEGGNQRPTEPGSRSRERPGVDLR